MPRMLQQGDEIVQEQGHDFYQGIIAKAEGNPIEGFDNSYFRQGNNVSKALTAGTATSGAEFIPTEYSPRFIKYIYLKSWARQAFGTWVIQSGDNMKVPKFDSPLTPDNPEYVATEITAALDSATSIREDAATTTDVTLTLKTIAINRQVQRKFKDYNVVPKAQMESFLREWVVKTLTETEEDVIVNGDTTASSSNINNAYNVTDHPHGWATAQNDFLNMFNGIRISATGTSVDAGGDAITVTDFTNAGKNQGKYGVVPEESIILVSTDMKHTMIRFTQVETLETYGPRATIMTGEIGKLYGSAVIVTDKLPNTQSDTLTNATGIRSSSTGTNLYTEAVVIYKESLMIGVPANSNSALNVSVYSRPDLDREHLIAREDFALGFAYTDAIVRIINVLP